jgi:hypothetical protein
VLFLYAQPIAIMQENAWVLINVNVLEAEWEIIAKLTAAVMVMVHVDQVELVYVIQDLLLTLFLKSVNSLALDNRALIAMDPIYDHVHQVVFLEPVIMEFAIVGLDLVELIAQHKFQYLTSTATWG